MATKQELIQAYKEKREAKFERYTELSEKAAAQSTASYEASNSAVSMIPMGQPILVGHHSERAHRNAIKRSCNAMDKSVELSNKSEYYADKAEATKNNNAISSDNPEAIDLLKAKIIKLQRGSEKSKYLNSEMRKFKNRTNAIKEVSKLEDSNENKKMFIQMLQSCDYWATQPERINAYYLGTTSNSAEISRLKKRVKQLESLDKIEEIEETINGVVLKTDKDDNRVRLFFDGKPDEDIRTNLKRNGFRWSPRNGCWQRHLTPYAIRIARDLIQRGEF